MWGLAILGLVLPWTFNLQYLLAGGSLMPEAFWRNATPTVLTTAITLDVYLAAFSFSVWVVAERQVKRPWGFVLLCFAVGLSLALPLYLLCRQWAPQTAAQ
ncbi:MAG: hypothetical protein C4K60_15380 [Ideonella sp. MAG2]|nr:MAG: hypothetical protein C4K60_15380 [Ideonella sp. MAG2]